jgi:hypothetical protein
MPEEEEERRKKRKEPSHKKNLGELRKNLGVLNDVFLFFRLSSSSSGMHSRFYS